MDALSYVTERVFNFLLKESKMTTPQKTLQELEKEYADVMNNEVITCVTQWVPKNSASEIPEKELSERIERFAPEAREIMREFDEGVF
jgi:hypothetical protein